MLRSLGLTCERQLLSPKGRDLLAPSCSAGALACFGLGQAEASVSYRAAPPIQEAPLRVHLAGVVPAHLWTMKMSPLQKETRPLRIKIQCCPPPSRLGVCLEVLICIVVAGPSLLVLTQHSASLMTACRPRLYRGDLCSTEQHARTCTGLRQRPNGEILSDLGVGR